MLVFLISGRLAAQDSPRLIAEYSAGYSWAHHRYMYPLTGKIVPGFQVAFSALPDPRKHAWTRLYNFPEIGISFLYQDLRHPSLGKIYAAFYRYHFFFTRRNAPFRWYLQLGNGLAYCTRPYHKISNPKNIIFGSHLLYAFQLSIRFRMRFRKNPLAMEGGIGLMHFSNGSWKTPNSGLNIPNLGIAFSYGRPLRFSTDSLPPPPGPERQKSTEIYARLGFNEPDVPGMGVRPAYTVGLRREWHPVYKSAYFAGAEAMWSLSLKEYLRYEEIAYHRYKGKIPPYQRVALTAGYGMYLGRTVFWYGAGVYVYNPSRKEKPVYFRLEIRRRLTRRWSAGISLKTHFFFAEIIDFGVHYRL